MSTNEEKLATTKKAMEAELKGLRRFALKLCREEPDRAEDLVQETLVRALGAIERYDPARKMFSWLSAILFNQYRDSKKKRREVADPDGWYAETLRSFPEQDAAANHSDVMRALKKLTAKQQHAIKLIAAGNTFTEAGRICKCSGEAVRLWVIQGRESLRKHLGLKDEDGFGPDARDLAIVLDRPRLGQFSQHFRKSRTQ